MEDTTKEDEPITEQEETMEEERTEVVEESAVKEEQEGEEASKGGEEEAQDDGSASPAAPRSITTKSGPDRKSVVLSELPIAIPQGRPAVPVVDVPKATTELKTPPTKASDGKAAPPTKQSEVKAPAKKSSVAPPAKKATVPPVKKTEPPRPVIKIDINNPVADLSGLQLKGLPREIGQHKCLQSLVITSNQLTGFPPAANLYHTLEVLNLSYNRLTAIPVSLASLELLADLNLSGNNIKEVPKEISKLQNLGELNLSHNKIDKLAVELTKIPNLHTLILDLNLLTQFPKEISQMQSLQILKCSLNKLQSTAGLGGLSNLQELDLSYNQLENLSDDFGNIQALSTLDLSYNQLKTVPAPIGKLGALKVLSLKNNRLESLNPTVFAGVRRLTELYAANNVITSIPDEVLRLGMLEILHLGTNSIATLPSNVSGLKKLAILQLGFNKLTVIPDQICTLSNLEELSIACNKIKALPAGIGKMQKLAELNLAYNELTSLPFGSDVDLPVLEKLFIAGNKLGGKLPISFTKLKRLNELYACDIGLTELPATIPALRYLQKVDFSHNKITSLPARMKELPYLISLNLSHNKLNKLDPLMIGRWERLQDLDLSHNELKEIPKEYKQATAQLGAELKVDNNPLEPAQQSTIVDSKRFKVGWAEMIGKRSNMEDAFVLQGCYEGKENLDLFGVYDGHATALASKFCNEHIPGMFSWLRSQKPESSPKQHLSELYQKFNFHFKPYLDAQHESYHYSGSTALTVLIKDKTAFVANLGDTRAVLSRKGKAIPLSVDHKPSDQGEEDRVKKLGGNITGSAVRRVNGILGVSRAVGDFYMKPFVSADPFVDEIALTSDDEFMILACDGVWDELSNQEAVDIVSSEPDPFKASSKLRDWAYLRGSDDNISVMVVRLK